MARIKFGLTITDARGSAGGITFTKGPGGSVVKTRGSRAGVVKNPFTTSLSVLPLVLNQWKLLPEANRLAWNNATALFIGSNVFGDTKRLTGANLFCKLNVYYFAFNDAFLLMPPMSLPVFDYFVNPIVVNVGTQNLDITPATNGSFFFTLCYKATPVLSAGITSGRFHSNTFLGAIGVNNPGVTRNCWNDYQSVFGTGLPFIKSGQKIAFEFFPVDPTTGITGTHISVIYMHP